MSLIWPELSLLDFEIMCMYVLRRWELTWREALFLRLVTRPGWVARVELELEIDMLDILLQQTGSWCLVAGIGKKNPYLRSNQAGIPRRSLVPKVGSYQSR